MNKEKKFFRAKLTDTCVVNTKMINGVALTKQWQVKVGEIGDFAKFPDVVVVKQGKGFVPAEETPDETEEEASDGSKKTEGPEVSDTSGDGTDVTAQPGDDLSADTGVSVEGSGDAPEFANMTVEQLKNFLIAKGVTQSELRNVIKPELIERAEFIWAQSNI